MSVRYAPMRIKPTAGTLIARLGLVPRPEATPARRGEPTRPRAEDPWASRCCGNSSRQATRRPGTLAAPELWLFQGATRWADRRHRR
ncbi:MAG: hypothetical protein R3C32_08175 [Chloroflexota bacterium]